MLTADSRVSARLCKPVLTGDRRVSARLCKPVLTGDKCVTVCAATLSHCSTMTIQHAPTIKTDSFAEMF